MVARVLLAGALCFLALWAMSVGALWAAQSQVVFMTANSRADTGVANPSIFQQTAFLNDEGTRLHAVILSHDDDRHRYWIMFCPPAGTSTLAQRIQNQLTQLWALGYNVPAFDYRGFGASAGQPSEAGLYADAASAYAFLKSRGRLSESDIILAGRSLGSAVAVDLATKVPAAGLLLFAPIDSVPAAAARIYPWAPVRLLTRYQFDTSSKAGRITVPVVLFHGSQDSYLPIAGAQRLLQQFRGPTLMIHDSGGHHHAGFVDVSKLYRGLRTFWPNDANPVNWR